MKKIHVVITMLTLFALTGCTRTYHVTRTSLEADQPCQGRRCTVLFRNGVQYSLRDLSFTADSMRWVDHTGSLQTRETGTAYSIRIRRPGRGALIGLAVGAVLGAGFIGTIVNDGDFFNYSAGEQVRYFGIPGALLGSAMGASIGSRKVYRLNPPSPRPTADTSLTSLQRPVTLRDLYRQ